MTRNSSVTNFRLTYGYGFELYAWQWVSENLARFEMDSTLILRHSISDIKLFAKVANNSNPFGLLNTIFDNL